MRGCLCGRSPARGKCVALCGGPVSVCVGSGSRVYAFFFNCATDMIVLDHESKVKVKVESILLKERP